MESKKYWDYCVADKIFEIGKLFHSLLVWVGNFPKEKMILSFHIACIHRRIISTLETRLLLFVSTQFGRISVLHQFSASIRKSDWPKLWLSHKTFTCSDWPAHSPDLRTTGDQRDILKKCTEMGGDFS